MAPCRVSSFPRRPVEARVWGLKAEGVGGLDTGLGPPWAAGWAVWFQPQRAPCRAHPGLVWETGGSVSRCAHGCPQTGLHQPRGPQEPGSGGPRCPRRAAGGDCPGKAQASSLNLRPALCWPKPRPLRSAVRSSLRTGTALHPRAWGQQSWRLAADVTGGRGGRPQKDARRRAQATSAARAGACISH